MLGFEEPECPMEGVTPDSFDPVTASIRQECRDVVARAKSVASDNSPIEHGDQYEELLRKSKELSPPTRRSTPLRPRHLPGAHDQVDRDTARLVEKVAKMWRRGSATSLQRM